MLPLPGVDEPTSAPDYMCRALSLLNERDIPFAQAWSSAINRIQAPQDTGGLAEDPALRSLVLEERGLLEESRPAWHAAYEGRPMTTMERATMIVRAQHRIEAGTSVVETKQAA